jgi:hypothetical protein
MAKPAAAKQVVPPPAGLRPEIPAMAFAVAGLISLIAVLSIFKMSNNDIWIHLKTGENVLKTWHVPQKDPYSFTASDHDYVAHEWLSGVLFYIVFAAAGVNGLIFFKSAVIFATCAALFGACRMLNADRAIMYLCFTMMLYIGSARFLERPHIFSYLFEALYLLCYFAYREKGRNRRWLYLIPLLHVPWTNLHGGHFQGIFMLVMLAAAEVVMYVRARWLRVARNDALPLKDVMLVCALPFACLLTALVNPYGYRLLTFPFELTGQEIFMKGIYEWQSALYQTYNLSSMFFIYIVWIALLFGSFLAVRGHSELRRGLRDTAWITNFVLAILWCVFVYQLASVYKSRDMVSGLERQMTFWCVVVGLFLLANLHRLEFGHAGIVALFFALSMRHNRAVTDASIATLPTLSHNLHRVAERFRPRTAASTASARATALWLAGLLMVGVAGYTALNSYYFAFDPPSKREMGLGIASNMPVGAVDYIEKNHITGNCFPSYNAAAMLIQRMWPEVRVAMDSRNDVYGETLYREYTSALSGGAALEAYLKKWPIDFFLITYGADRSPAFFKVLDSSPDWRLVFFDDRSVVYLRNIPRFQNIIKSDGYQFLEPAQAGVQEIRTEDAAQWLAEAQRAVAAAPNAWSPLQYLSKSLVALERLDEAEAASRRILDIAPDAYFAWADLGYVYIRKRDNAAAAGAFTRCLEIRPDYSPCRELLDRMSRQ